MFPWFFAGSKNKMPNAQMPPSRPAIVQRRFVAAAVIGDHAAQDRVERMHQSGGAQQRRRIHFSFDEKETGKVSEELVEIHERALTLPLAS